jgi:Mor family transcriptional regulator
MKYIKADSVFPIALVEELQSYIQGGYIYVPSRKDSKKKWGELSGCRYEIEQRNRKIRKDYQQGKSVDELADIYYLSVHSIRKIIYEK